MKYATTYWEQIEQLKNQQVIASHHKIKDCMQKEKSEEWIQQWTIHFEFSAHCSPQIISWQHFLEANSILSFLFICVSSPLSSSVPRQVFNTWGEIP